MCRSSRHVFVGCITPLKLRRGRGEHDLSEYTSYDALGLAALVRKREVTPAELAHAAFAAMDAVNDRLNAIVGQVEPPVRDKVFEADAAFAGVPFVVKDLWHG